MGYTGNVPTKGTGSKEGVTVLLAVYDLYNSTATGINIDDTVPVVNCTCESGGGTALAKNGKAAVETFSLTGGSTLREIVERVVEENEKACESAHLSGALKGPELPTTTLPPSPLATLYPKSIIKGSANADI